MPEDHLSSALVSPVSNAASTIGTMLSSSTEQDSASVTVTEPEDLSKSIYASASTANLNIEVVELSSRPLQAQACSEIERLKEKKDTGLADRVAKVAAMQKKSIFSRKNR